MSLLTEEEAQARYQQAIGRIVIAPYEQRDLIADEEARQVDAEIAVQALKRQMLAHAREQARRLEREIEKPVIGDVEVGVRDHSEDIPFQRQSRRTPKRHSVSRPSIGRSFAAEVMFIAKGEYTDEFLESVFRLRSGRPVKWRDATESEVQERREIWEDQLNRSGDGLALCDKVLADLRRTGARTLGLAIGRP